MEKKSTGEEPAHRIIPTSFPDKLLQPSLVVFIILTSNFSCGNFAYIYTFWLHQTYPQFVFLRATKWHCTIVDLLQIKTYISVVRQCNHIEQTPLNVVFLPFWSSLVVFTIYLLQNVIKQQNFNFERTE